MAISFTSITAYNSNSGATSYSTASISPSSNKLILVTVRTYRSTATPNTPTLSGLGLTWEVVANQLETSLNTRRITMFRGVGTVTAGTITADFAGQTQSTAGIIVDEIDGVQTGNNGADAIRQVVTGTTSGTLTGASITIPFTLKSTSNAAYGVVWKNAANNVVVGSGFTQVSYSSGTNAHLVSEYKLDTRTVNWTWASTSSCVPTYIAIELSETMFPRRTLSANQTGDGVTSKSFTYSVPTGSYLSVVRIMWRGTSAAQTISSATFGGNALTLVKSQASSGSNNPSSAVYSYTSPTAGNNTIAITFSGTSNCIISVESWTAVNVQVKDSASVALANSASPSVTLTSAIGRGEFSYDVWSTNNARTWTAASGQYYDFSDNSSGATNSVKGTASYIGIVGTTTMSHTLDSAAASLAGVSYTIQEVPTVVTFTPLIYLFS